MRKTRNLIRDGYNYSGSIPAESTHAGLDVEYRPILPEEADEVHSYKLESNEKFHEALREAAASHVTAWSEWDDSKDQMAEITPEAVGRLPSELFWSLWNLLNSAPPATETLEADTKN